MGLSVFHLITTRTQYIDIWLLVTCLRTLTSFFCFAPFTRDQHFSMQFHHSFTHLISFSSNGALTSNKITQHPKKVENNRKPMSAVNQ
ncbi:uncharacterized protein N7518_009306 [Penicillium psychrosexuale]|uniref:uncharacterized protein n=1 Tax=Penicillium psychrosexuale TaxID=1002107 RepID=UPI002544EA3A|nr:uncharacterized protein N7518_009306 [Penicillium psychrosexuale]KAJ5783629.1 hypothetical protein N7518_009306 [Penicillium psychrosexuale]